MGLLRLVGGRSRRRHLRRLGLVTGKPYSAFGVSCVWHPTAVGTPDILKAAGQEVAVSGKGRTLLLTAFSKGNVSSDVATVHFTNGQTRQVTLSLPKELNSDCRWGCKEKMRNPLGPETGLRRSESGLIAPPSPAAAVRPGRGIAA